MSVYITEFIATKLVDVSKADVDERLYNELTGRQWLDSTFNSILQNASANGGKRGLPVFVCRDFRRMYDSQYAWSSLRKTTEDDYY